MALFDSGRAAWWSLVTLTAMLAGACDDPPPPQARVHRAPSIAPSTRIEPLPRTQQHGDVALSASQCTLDGPPFVSSSIFTAIGGIARAPDGSIYVLDTELRVRRYTLAPGDACRMMMDPRFGESGFVRVDAAAGARPGSIHTDAAGRVYASSQMGGAVRISDGRVDARCADAPGRISVAPDGDLALIDYPGRVVQRVIFHEDGCAVSAWSAHHVARSNAVSIIDDDRVLVGGPADFGAPHLIRLFSRAGAPEGEPFGDPTRSSTAPDRFCSVGAAVEGAEGRLYVLDENCRALVVFDRARRPAARVHLSALVGLPYPWFTSISIPVDGIAYLTASQCRHEPHDECDGYVFRVSGL